MEFLIIVAMIGIGIAVAAAQANKRKLTEAWSEAAAELRIQHNPGDLFSKPELYGKVRQCSVKVTIRTKSRGNRSAKYTHYEITYSQPLAFGLHLKEQTAFSGIKKLLGGQDIEIGDTTFDDFVVVKSHDPIQAREFLNPARRLYVRRILSMHSGAEITDSFVKWDSKGAADNPGTIVSTVKHLVDFAVTLTSGAEQPSDEPNATGPERVPDKLEAVFTVREPSEPQVYTIDSMPVPDAPVDLEVEERKAIDAVDEFDRMGRDVEELLQADSMTGTDAESLEVNQLETPALGDLDVHRVCRDLFATGKASFEINELFKQRYQGSGIQWSGELMRVDHYPFDLVFGNKPGAKAELEIDQLESESFGSTSVKAVIQLPRDAREALNERIGETLAFEGTLVKCDSFMRVLFVADGRIAEPD
jgi:hypothetical protein